MLCTGFIWDLNPFLREQNRTVPVEPPGKFPSDLIALQNLSQSTHYHHQVLHRETTEFTMRLINTNTLVMSEFYGDNIPPYAILSHRWEIEEVTFQDMMAGVAQEKMGYAKLLGCCEKARKDGWEFAVSLQLQSFFQLLYQ